ncbi:MAG: radical SAM protein [Thermodesulfobacteriota bacterium]
MSSYLATEKGTIRKKWKGRLPLALIYPNTYSLAVSNLGFQLVYSLLNGRDDLVCERFVYPAADEPLRSLESNRPLTDFPLVLGSISFEDDYPRLVALLAAGGLEPVAEARADTVGPGNPLVILGGVAVFMNPEPLASFADLMVIGEAEPVLIDLVHRLEALLTGGGSRRDMIRQVARQVPACYAPSLYSFSFGADGRVLAMEHEPGVPARVRRAVVNKVTAAAHSQLLSPEAELGMFMTELGRGCSRGCRFCAAGFIYRPPRLWSEDAVLGGLADRPAGMARIGLLGMEMAEAGVLDRVADYLAENACLLSFSSLRADRISDRILELLAASRLKSAAIAPDGASERLRRVINKGLDEEDLVRAGTSLVAAGIVNLKLYVMIGLPTETEEDLAKLAALVRRLHGEVLAIGRERGRVSALTLSVNSFVPKPWTPFQYLPFGGLDPEVAARCPDEKKAVLALKEKIKYLRKSLAGLANLRIKVDRPERVLQQAVLARGDRRLAPVLLDMAVRGMSMSSALRRHGLDAWQYAVRPRDKGELLPWEVVDHGITGRYLWQEYCRAMAGKKTSPCDTARCRRCGACDETVSA